MKTFLRIIEEFSEHGSLVRNEYLLSAGKFVKDEILIQGSIVELGSYRGGLTIKLAKIANELGIEPIFAVDLWKETETAQSKLERISEEIYQSFLDKLESFNVSDDVFVIRQDTAETGENWDEGPISFLVIDANHRYEAVVQDIISWKDHVIEGGYIFVDDFGPWDGTNGPQGAVEDKLLKTQEAELIDQIGCYALLKKLN